MALRKEYANQVEHANDRNIPWLFSYEGWLLLWFLSEEAFRGDGNYRVRRYKNEGVYSARNCYVALYSDVIIRDRKTIAERDLQVISLYQTTLYTKYQIAGMLNLRQSTVHQILPGVEGYENN